MRHWTTFKRLKEPPRLKTRSIRQGKKFVCKYEPIFFDSETSKDLYTNVIDDTDSLNTGVVKDCWVYIWACTVGDGLYYGRYLHEFMQFLHLIQDTYSVSEDNPMDIYVHNLSFDISYMYDLLFTYSDDLQHSGLWTAFRKCITYSLGNGYTFKCSYRLSGRPLAKWAKDLNVEHKKQEGMIDYNHKIYPWDKLPHDEYKYLAYDVLTLKDCFYKECDVQKYNFANIPLTMTGFVRKDFQRAYMKKGKYFTNSNIFAKTRVNDEQYKRLLRASAGGMTAVSIYAISQLVEHEGGIGHVDFESHYPTQQICKRYPMQPISVKKYGDNNSITLKVLDWYVNSFNYYYIVDIVLHNIKLRKGVSAPFLFRNKCQIDINADIVQCNGKIISVNGVIKCSLTNFDLDIIRDQFTIDGYEIEAVDLYTTAYLPDYVRGTIKKFYKNKSDLKNRIKEDPNNEELTTEYNSIAKPKLNSVFGCMYTRLVRPEITLTRDFEFKTDYKAHNLEEYYEKKTSCLAYQWGVFTTSLARYELWYILKNVIGYENFLYCDTDSAFFKGSPEIEKRIDDYNGKCLKDSKEHNYSVTLDNGDIKYFHKLEREHDHLKSKTFKALHAKCYALEPEGVLECTIAGVVKKAHGITREEELKSIHRLKSGTVFKKCGGTRADYTTIRAYEEYTGGGCAILDTTKELSEVIYGEERII